jgi:cytochrome c biogenesis protein CcmG/thiol:disulfide interchange protein DsbE
VKGGYRLALVALVAVVVAQVLVQRSGRVVQLGERPDGFTLASTDGTSLELASLRGRVVAVNFWATWCPPCLRELPELTAARQADGGRCLEVVGVAEESASDAVASAARLLPYPVVLDPRAKVAAAWGVAAYPRTFLLDREGRLARVFEGPLDRVQLEAAAAPLLAPGCREARP